MLYGSFPMHRAILAQEVRLLLTLFAFGWILALLTLVPDRHIPASAPLGGARCPSICSTALSFGPWQNFGCSFLLPGQCTDRLLHRHRHCGRTGQRKVRKPCTLP